jgi:hypothetical protein
MSGDELSELERSDRALAAIQVAGYAAMALGVILISWALL